MCSLWTVVYASCCLPTVVGFIFEYFLSEYVLLCFFFFFSLVVSLLSSDVSLTLCVNRCCSEKVMYYSACSIVSVVIVSLLIVIYICPLLLLSFLIILASSFFLYSSRCFHGSYLPKVGDSGCARVLIVSTKDGASLLTLVTSSICLVKPNFVI